MRVLDGVLATVFDEWPHCARCFPAGDSGNGVDARRVPMLHDVWHVGCYERFFHYMGAAQTSYP